MNANTNTCTTINSPLGPLLLSASPRGLSGLWFIDQRHRPTAAVVDRWTVSVDHPVFQAVTEQLKHYFMGQPTRFAVPLDLSAGTPFQQLVWQSLLKIPNAITHTYGEIAVRVARPSAARAVAAAIGRNPLSIVVPCHRILGSGGALTGYAGGLDRKAALLRLERGDGLLV